MIYGVLLTVLYNSEVFMERQFVIENKRERERLRALVNEITEEELNMVIYKEGWTIAVVLAHLAFYDERRRVLLRKWKKKGVKPSPHDEYVINNTLLPFLSLIPSREAAKDTKANSRGR